MSISKTFVLGGNSIFTIEPAQKYLAAHADCQAHYTYRVSIKEKTDRYPEAIFASLLSGPDNLNDYTYLGMVNRNSGEVRLTRASRYAEDSQPVAILRRVLARLWADEGHVIEAAGWKVHHEGRCGVCGRTLTVPESIEDGIGPVCREKLGLGPLLRNGQVITEEGTEPKVKKARKPRKVKAQTPAEEEARYNDDVPDLGDSVLLGPSFPDHDLLH